MELEEIAKILKETSESVSNGHSIEVLEGFKARLEKAECKSCKKNLKYAINILEEVIRLKEQLKKQKNPKQRRETGRKLLGFLILFGLIMTASASINYKIDDRTVFKISNDTTLITNTVIGESPIKLQDSIEFLNETGNVTFSLYIAKIGEDFTNVSDDFNGSLILETRNGMERDTEMCFWNRNTQQLAMCINQGGLGMATTIRRSLQIVGNDTFKENNISFILCEGNNHVDCASDITGADLFVQDDIEADSIFANENLSADETLIVGEPRIFINSSTPCELQTHNFVVNVSLGDQPAANKLEISRQDITILNCGNSSIITEIITML